MDSSTQTRPGFPAATAWSVVVGAGDRRLPGWERHLDTLIRRYWKPVLQYLVRRWRLSREDAADLTQEFFGRLYERNLIEEASPERGRFRTFLKLKLRDLVVDDLRRKSAQKRGGGAAILSLDEFRQEHAHAPEEALTPEDEFDRNWASELMASSLRDLETALHEEGKPEVYRAFFGCILADPPKSYRECAEELGVRVRDVGHYVFRARVKFRKILHERVRDLVEKEEDVAEEMEHLLRLLRVSP